MARNKQKEEAAMLSRKLLVLGHRREDEPIFGLIFDVSCVHYVSTRLQKISTMSFHCFCKSFLFVQIFNILFITFYSLPFCEYSLLFHNPNHTYRKYCSSYLKWLYSKLDNTYERKVEGKYLHKERKQREDASGTFSRGSAKR